MGLSTDVRIGWDASKAKAGFAALRTMFAGTFRVFRQMGIGSAREVGARMTDLLGRAVMALPDGMREMMDWAGDLNDMSTQTGLAVSKLVVLQEALRLAGAESGDSGRMLSTLGKNINDAVKGMGPARDALHELGLQAKNLKGLKLDEIFEKVGKAVAARDWKVGELEETMGALFGAKMGYKLIRFFKDFDGGMKQAENNVGSLSRKMESDAGSIDAWGDALGRWRNRWREGMVAIMSFLQGKLGSTFIDDFFDKFSADNIRNSLVYLRETSIGFFKSLAADISKIMSDALRDAFVPEWLQKMQGSRRSNDSSIAPSRTQTGQRGWNFQPMNIGDTVRAILNAFSGKQTSAVSEQLLRGIYETNLDQRRSLQRIENSGFPAYMS